MERNNRVIIKDNMIVYREKSNKICNPNIRTKNREFSKVPGQRIICKIRISKLWYQLEKCKNILLK